MIMDKCRNHPERHAVCWRKPLNFDEPPEVLLCLACAIEEDHAGILTEERTLRLDEGRLRRKSRGKPE